MATKVSWPYAPPVTHRATVLWVTSMGWMGWMGCADAPTQREAPTVQVEPEPAEPIVQAREPSEPEPTPAPLELEDATLPGLNPFGHDELLGVLRTAASREFKPVGHTSVVFRMRLDSPHTAAFRPRTRDHRRGHLAEIAAYALGRALGLDNVVPATLRYETKRRISERLHPRYDDYETRTDIENRIFYLTPYDTPGAAIYWVPNLSETDLDEAQAEWQGWLSEDPIPPRKSELARDLSNMRVFDYLVGNWDRFSGGNLKVFGGEPVRVALRDHNVAFGRLAPRRERQLREAVVATRRFSRRTVERMQRLDAPTLVRFIGELNAAEELERLRLEVLTDDELESVIERSHVVLSHVGALIAEYGEETVLAFP